MRATTLSLALLLFFVASSVLGLNNGLARTPPMGWNSWNHYGCRTNLLTEQMFMSQAKAMVDSGMAKVGYQYINLDDCWLASERDAQGRLQPDPVRFPHGIKYLADYVHSLGLKFGIYEDTGPKTCGGWPGSEGYYKIDAQTYAEWDVDYFKLDGCFSNATQMKEIYTSYGLYLNQTGRPMVYSCSWPTYAFVHQLPMDWDYIITICNLWREYYDIKDDWNSWTNILDYQASAALNRWAGPGHWNDPDMLEVGNGGQTFEEYKAHFSLWAILAAPLVAGNDLTNMTQQTLSILTNEEVIKVDQDPMGVQGTRLWQNTTTGTEVWARPLQDKSHAVVLFNRGAAASNVTVTWESLGLASTSKANIRDLWDKKDSGPVSQQFTASVASHAAIMVKISLV
eukprot:TRINITY_DN205_c0_g1_i2.p1 TRINITY_DN205_c0_g1~~TRINITY_DN205_c0_g1_i2.p1  ORF type:complete len:414 (-),score=92.28 TRINITY_DN205_c0_g1_i2:89-1279(-)